MSIAVACSAASSIWLQPPGRLVRRKADARRRPKLGHWHGPRRGNRLLAEGHRRRGPLPGDPSGRQWAGSARARTAARLMQEMRVTETPETLSEREGGQAVDRRRRWSVQLTWWASGVHDGSPTEGAQAGWFLGLRWCLLSVLVARGDRCSEDALSLVTLDCLRYGEHDTRRGIFATSH
jgi:hypothetical protein